MMKNSIILLSCFLFTTFSLSACATSDNLLVQTNNSVFTDKNKNDNPLPADSISGKPSKTPVKQIKFAPDKKIAWYGSITADQLKASNDDSPWIGDDENPEYNQIGMVVDVDILNCAGYLVSGKMYKEGNYGWRFEPMPKTVAADATTKIERCHTVTEPEDNSEGVFTGAFAVAPQDKSRQKIKIGEVDTKKAFASLPKDTKRWLNEEKVFYKTEYGAKFRRKNKLNLSLKEGDDWTDIDGDGEIDLVYVSSICNVEDTEGDNCGRILMKINGKWKQVGLIQKA